MAKREVLREVPGPDEMVPDPSDPSVMVARPTTVMQWIIEDFEPEIPTVTPEQVDAERDRRIAVGVTFGGKVIQMRPFDVQNIAGAAQLAALALMAGVQPGDLRWHGGTSDFGWIASDNTVLPLDAPAMVALGRAAASWQHAHIFAARAVKDMSPIPTDYAADHRWPA